MNLIMLVQDCHKPIPDDIEVVQDFGDEAVRVQAKDGSASIARGSAVFMTATPEAFANWLRPFDGVWTTTNPMAGTWSVHHIKENA